MTGEIAHKGDKAPIQAGQRWHVERTNAWHNAFNRLQRCYERDEDVIDAFFDLADAIITVRRLIREAWTLYRSEDRPGQATMTTHLSARSRENVMLALLNDVPVISHWLFRLVLGAALILIGVLVLHHNIILIAVGALILLMGIVRAYSVLTHRNQKEEGQ